MTRRALPTVAVVVLLGAALPGCVLKRSQQARTYVLDPLAAVEAEVPAGEPVAVLGVLRVAVPGWIDRPQVAARSGGGEIVTDEYARWGEPVAKGIQRVVAENLAALLPDYRILAAPFATQDAVHRRLRLTLVEAARQPDGTVRLEARWELLDTAGTTLARRRSTHQASGVAPGAAGAVDGLSRTLAGLSREIAETLRGLPQPAATAHGANAHPGR